MKQQQSLSSISQASQMEVSTKRHSIRQEKEAAKKQKLETTKAAENEVDEKQKVETTKAENEVDEKQQVESTKAEKEVAEKQKVDSTEDEKEIAYDSDDAYDELVKSYDGPDWEQRLFPVSSPEPEDGEDSLSIPSISMEDSEEEETSSEELSSPQAVTVVSKVGEE
ncbi:hypothetical protein P8452_74016 [Trifolium repens]|nr:hypothetical protein P8452_74016 [Trifolium repens]